MVIRSMNLKDSWGVWSPLWFCSSFSGRPVLSLFSPCADQASIYFPFLSQRLYFYSHTMAWGWGGVTGASTAQSNDSWSFISILIFYFHRKKKKKKPWECCIFETWWWHHVSKALLHMQPPRSDALTDKPVSSFFLQPTSGDTSGP